MAGSSRAVHWPTGSGGWSSALTQFAKSTSPRTQLPDGVYLRSDQHTIAIYDGYPKARFHFLVLPRIPFQLEGGTAEPRSPSVEPPKLALTGGKLVSGTSAHGKVVPSSHLASLSDLLASPYAGDVLARMRAQSEAVVQLIKQEMCHVPLPAAVPVSASTASKDTHVDRTTCAVQWGIQVGFHAVPSMDTIHLHIVSNDFVSDRLKHKKHYQSFHPTHGFWLALEYVEKLVKDGKKSLPHSPRYYEQLLKAPLISFRDGTEYANMPKLKQHLEQAWIEEIAAKRRANDVTASPATERRADRELSNGEIAVARHR